VLDSLTNFIEHPQAVASASTRVAERWATLSRDPGTDCGFETSAAGAGFR